MPSREVTKITLFAPLCYFMGR